MLRFPELSPRLQGLMRSVHQDADGHFHTGPRQVYILPSRFGVMFSALLIAMLIGSINYANNLGFLLTFFLAAVGLIAMVQTWLNLLDLDCQVQPVASTFAGQPLSLKLKITNPSDRWRGSILLASIGHDDICEHDLEPQQSVTYELFQPTQQRGRFIHKGFKISSQYPLGLFTAWCYLRHQRELLIYPKPSAPFPLRFASEPVDGQQGTRGSGNEDFTAHRDYLLSDSPRHIDWKVFAREKGLKIKLFSGSDASRLWLSLELFSHLGFEQAISHLTRAVIEADKNSWEYGLRLGEQSIEPCSGQQHRQLCLKALALYGS